MNLSIRYEHDLPVKGKLANAYLVSMVIALVMTMASIAGLLGGSSIYPGLDTNLLSAFVGQDALNIIVGLPMLLGSMWLTRRGSLIGLLLWPGALFYVLYDYGYYVLGAPFNAFFLPYIALITLSGYAMLGLVATIDRDAVRERLATIVRPRLVGGFLATVALLFMTLWTVTTLSALFSGTTLGIVQHVVMTMDLTVQLPAMLVGGILLWRREPLAYVIAGGLLLQAGVYLQGLSIIIVAQEVVTSAPFDPVAIIPGFIVGVICIVLLRPFVQGAAEKSRTRSLPTQVAESSPVKM